jgi:heme a synthase
MLRGLTSFQRLALWTTATTYLLILVGGLVRASGAGLGCPDWPRCFGSWIPPLSAAELPAQFDAAQFNPTLMWTEYLNRLLGVSVGFFIFATMISAIRHHRRTPQILWTTAAAFVLVGFEGWLGGVVVEHELAAWIVTVHLIVALVIVSLLVYATMYALFADGDGRMRSTSARPVGWWVLALILLTTVQVGLGAQVRGKVDEALSEGVSRTAAVSTVGAYDYWHRDAAIAVLGLAVAILFIVLRRHASETSLVRVSYALVLLVGLQVGVGVSMAYITLTPAAQVAHLTTSSLLLGAETVLFLLARWLPTPAG